MVGHPVWFYSASWGGQGRGGGAVSPSPCFFAGVGEGIGRSKEGPRGIPLAGSLVW